MHALHKQFLNLTPYVIHLAIRASIMNTLCYLAYTYSTSHAALYIFAASGVFLVAIIETIAINEARKYRLYLGIFVSLSGGVTLACGSIFSQNIEITSLVIILFMLLIGVTSQANLVTTMAVLTFSAMFITGSNFPAPLNHCIIQGITFTLGGLALVLTSYIHSKFYVSNTLMSTPLAAKPPLFSFKRAQIDFTLRLIVAVLGSYLLAVLLHLQQSYWVPLTAMLILKTENSYTWKRLKERFTGTLYGSIPAIILISLIQDKLILILLLLPVTFLLITSLAKHYGAYAFFLTAMVTIGFNIVEPLGWLITEERIINTALGVTIVALVTYISHRINQL